MISEDNPQPQTVMVDIGGTQFKTTRETLQKEKASRFFEDLEYGTGTELFYDRDPTHFRHILNHLRCGTKAILPPDRTGLEELLVEARFYKLFPLIQHIKNCVPVTVNIVGDNNEVYSYTEPLLFFVAREQTSKLARLAQDHALSGLPIFIKKKHIPYFSTDNFTLVMQYLKVGESGITDNTARQLQTMHMDFLSFFGLQNLQKLRMQQHNEKVRKLSLYA